MAWNRLNYEGRFKTTREKYDEKVLNNIATNEKGN